MHGTASLKVIDAKQVKDIYRYKNIRRKLYRINAAIWYNKTCRQGQLISAYVNIRINGKKQQCQKTLRTANQYRINQEIKFLYTKKKIKLNEQLFKLHLKCADNWQRIWPLIIKSIDYKLTKEMETHYNNLNRKTRSSFAANKYLHTVASLGFLFTLIGIYIWYSLSKIVITWRWPLLAETCSYFFAIKYHHKTYYHSCVSWLKLTSP